MTDPRPWPQFAIPSYQRPGILSERTLPLLYKLGVPGARITIFVADREQALEYRDACDPRHYRRIVVGEPGMGAIRRFIQFYYRDGEHVVNVDDDISGFYRKRDDKKYIEIGETGFKQMVDIGFYSCRETRSRLWGIYPVLNPMFMKSRVRVGLTYIVGAFWGVINSHDATLSVTLDDKEDFERTLKFYVADGNVVRLEAYSLKTGYYSTPGGMQITRTPERIDWSARELVARYPGLCKLNLAKKSGKTEVRLTEPKKQVLT